MGLDMFLSGHKYFYGHLLDPAHVVQEDGFRVKSKELDLGYWRKHADLHEYIVDNFADGHDHCQQISLSANDMRDIIVAIREDGLPQTSAFYYGSRIHSQEVKANDTAIFERAIQWLTAEDDSHWRTVTYQASW